MHCVQSMIISATMNFNPDTDPTLDEYRDDIEKLTVDELIEETSTDEHFTLDEFMERWV